MYNQYNFQPKSISFCPMKNIIDQFSEYLTTNRKVSSVTLKNYLSDLRHFLSWLSHNEDANLNILEKINNQILGKYKSFLLSQKSAKSTINRRLATLRIFCQFCFENKLLSKNYTQSISNFPTVKSTDKKIHDLVSKFGNYLKKKQSSRNTIKNYTADIKRYLSSTITDQ